MFILFCPNVRYSNDYDSIKHELSQKRDAIAKHIVNTGKGIPTTPYINTDPEERSVFQISKYLAIPAIVYIYLMTHSN